MTEKERISDVIDRLWGPEELVVLRMPEDNEILTELTFAIQEKTVELAEVEAFVTYLEAA